MLTSNEAVMLTMSNNMLTNEAIIANKLFIFVNRSLQWASSSNLNILFSSFN